MKFQTIVDKEMKPCCFQAREKLIQKWANPAGGSLLSVDRFCSSCKNQIEIVPFHPDRGLDEVLVRPPLTEFDYLKRRLVEAMDQWDARAVPILALALSPEDSKIWRTEARLRGWFKSPLLGLPWIPASVTAAIPDPAVATPDRFMEL